MPSLNFQKQFVPLIESGKKRQTIRRLRKNPIKTGDNLYLFTGLRTKGCQKLFTPYNVKGKDVSVGTKIYAGDTYDWVICKSVSKIHIYAYRVECYDLRGFHPMFYSNAKFNGLERLIKADGFKSIDDFKNFFKKHYGLPFEGVLIKW